MIKPRDCLPTRLAKFEQFIDGELARRYMPGEHVTLTLKDCTDDLREQLARMYSVHWSVTHGFSGIYDEHWMTFEDLPSESV
jgi:hypothetical protein